VIDRQDHCVVHDLTPARGEFDDDARADLVVQHVAVALAHACEPAWSDPAASSVTDVAGWNAGEDCRLIGGGPRMQRRLSRPHAPAA
jgi:hypothetical protein